MDRRSFLQTTAGSLASLALPRELHAGGGGGQSSDGGTTKFVAKAIESAAFPGVFLRIDANGFNVFNAAGGGTVSCRRGISRFEVFSVEKNPDDSISIGSLAFPNIYLRLDASGIRLQSPEPGGVVNCQYSVGPWEKFRLVSQPDGSVRIMCNEFRLIYLRMDGSGVGTSEGSIGGVVKAESSINDYGKFYIRDVPGTMVKDTAADYPYAFSDMYMAVFGGVDFNRLVLGASGTGTVSIQDADDLSNQQGWIVRPVPGVLDQFHIALSPKSGQQLRYLTASANGPVTLATLQTGTLSQQWQFEPLDVAAEYCYRVRVTGGTSSTAQYLSARQDSHGLVLVASDGGSGREKWHFVPRTEITPEALPQWDYQFSVNLGQYLNDHASRSVIRLFACEVIVDSEVEWLTSLERPPADIRIDCTYLRFQGTNPTLDVSGTSAGSIPQGRKNNPLDYGSFCPSINQTPARGMRGFDAGRLEINTQVLHTEKMLGGIGLFAAGGNGGCGQRGYMGRPGGLGLNGEAGGQGGIGGQGGDGGTIRIRANGFVPPGSPVVGWQSADGGEAGPGGLEGAGGPGGAPSSVGGAPGRAGRDGAPGNTDIAGKAGDIWIGQDDQDAQQYWLQDAQPDSMRLRLFTAIRSAMNTLIRTGNLQEADNCLYWLYKTANYFKYDDVLTSISNALDTLDQNKTSTAWLDTLRQQQVLSMRADTLKSELILLSNIPSDNSGVSIATQVVQQMMRRPPDMTAPRPAGVHPMGATDHDPDWISVINGILADMPNGSSLVSLEGLIGDDACAGPEFCSAVKQIAPGDISGQPSGGNRGIRPMGFFFVIPLVALGAAYLGLQINMHTSYQLQKRARERERQRREEERRRQEEALRRYQDELNKWNQQQQQRNDMDQINEDTLDLERERERRRQQRERKRTDETPVIVAFGTEYIGVLDSLEPVEGEEDSYIAVFDAFMNIFVSNPMLCAAATFLLANLQTFMIEVKVDGITARSLALGDWHALTLTPMPGSKDTMFASYVVPYPRVKDGRMALFMLAAPDIPIRLISAYRLSFTLSIALDIVFQNTQVPVKESKKAARRNVALVTAAATQLEVLQNVGQGSFHTFSQDPTFAFDLGDGPPLNTTADAQAKMTQLAVHGMNAAIVLSHWDKDHYKGMLKHPVQGACPVIAPSFGIRGPMVTGLVRAIASNGAGHLYLAGSYNPTFVDQDPVVTAGTTIYKTITPIMDHQDVQIPRNVSLDLSERTYEDANQAWDKNNVESITAYISGVNNNNMRLLLPGDCSYSYISTAHKMILTHIEATHHGSFLSILQLTGQRWPTPDNSDIPQCSNQRGGTVYYSYGANNHHGHDAANVRNYYETRGWTVEVKTATDAQGGAVQIQL